MYSSSNALDFYIACYVEKMSVEDKDGYFYIVSKDTWFDFLVKYLRARKIKTLSNTINLLFTKKIEENELNEVFNGLFPFNPLLDSEENNDRISPTYSR
ncbi:hypothetical protein JWG39_13570 [Desulforhopalus vacuolatus]|uniref:PIN domain-containing protein n=1 Tax=Desulforhopalus vacuolatus TaxID=40414 RepID=UPI00196566AC|nr:hypothetical protein [Desulforhopalus vacuolatus]